MKRNNIEVVKPNSVAEARGSMSKCFLDLLDISMHEVTKDNVIDEKKLDYIIDIRKYSERLGTDLTKTAFRKFRKNIGEVMKSDSLISMNIGEGHFVDFFVFQEVEYFEKDKKIRVVFSKRFKEMLTKLLIDRGRKIYYSLPDTLQMSSEYSKRLYPILLERVHKDGEERVRFNGNGSLRGENFDRIFDIKTFREMIDIPDSYRMNNIRKICDTVIEEIEKCTPYKAEVFYNVTIQGAGGRPITHICWNMQNKKETLIPGEDKSESESIREYEEIVTNYAKENDIDLTLKNISSIASEAVNSKRTTEEVNKILKYTQEYKKTHPVETSDVALLIYMMQSWEEPKGTRRASGKKKTEKQRTDYNKLVMEELIESMNESGDRKAGKTNNFEIVEENGTDGDELPGQLSFVTDFEN